MPKKRVAELETRIAQLESEVACLRASEARWQSGFERMREGFIMGDVVRDATGRGIDWRYVAANPAWERLTGLSRDVSLGRTVREVVPHIEPRWVDDLILVAETGEPLVAIRYFTVLNRWLEFHAYQIEQDRFAMFFLDVTERQQSEDRQRVLLRELSHRVKNTLTVVQSIASQTAHTYAQPEKFVAMFQARLLALGRSHDILLQRQWQGAPLGAVVHEAMKPYATLINNTVLINTANCAPGILLTPSQTLAVGMALCELATNATKYGALSKPGGIVMITCVQPVGSEASVTWVEKGGPPIVEPPQRKGFGLRLLSHATTVAAGVNTDLRFEPEGVRCTLRMAPPVYDQ